jgi:RimJ/RimL family protein N-acetyltransferase
MIDRGDDGGARVALRPPTPSDLDFIRWLWSDPETMRPVGGPVELTDEGARRWFAAMVDPGSPGDVYRLIVDGGGMSVGEISFHWLQSGTMTAELNVKVASPYRGNGYARAAMRTFLDSFFHEIGGRVMIDDLAVGNVGGQQALLRFGFERVDGGPAVRLRLTREAFEERCGRGRP